MPFNGGPNGHPKSREQSQRKSQRSGGFFRPPVGKDPPLSPHDVGETTAVGAATSTFSFELHDCYLQISFNQWFQLFGGIRKTNTCLSFYIGQWCRQKRILDHMKWNNECETSLKALQGLQNKGWSLPSTSWFSSSIHKGIFTGQISKLG